MEMTFLKIYKSNLKHQRQVEHAKNERFVQNFVFPEKFIFRESKFTFSTGSPVMLSGSSRSDAILTMTVNLWPEFISTFFDETSSDFAFQSMQFHCASTAINDWQ